MDRGFRARRLVPVTAGVGLVGVVGICRGWVGDEDGRRRRALGHRSGEEAIDLGHRPIEQPASPERIVRHHRHGNHGDKEAEPQGQRSLGGDGADGGRVGGHRLGFIDAVVSRVVVRSGTARDRPA